MATSGTTTSDSHPAQPAQPAVSVTGLDHIVLLSADVEQALAFYTGVLGLDGVRVAEWRRGEVPFPSVRIDGATIIDLFPVGGTGAATPAAPAEPGHQPAGRNLDHLCLTVEPVDLHALAASGTVTVVRGPTDHLFGAQGYATSLYVADPDGNTVELRSYDEPGMDN